MFYRYKISIKRRHESHPFGVETPVGRLTRRSIEAWAEEPYRIDAAKAGPSSPPKPTPRPDHRLWIVIALSPADELIKSAIECYSALVQHEPKVGWKRRRKRLHDLAEIAMSPMPRRGNSLSECLFAFVEVAIGSYCGYLVLSTLNRSYAASREMSEFVLRPAWIIFFTPPCMACLGLVLLFHDRIKARLFNDALKREILRSWHNPVLPDFLHKISVVWSTAFLALSLSLIPVHTRFTGGQMTTQALWPMPERHHPYTDIKSIALAFYYSPPSAHSRGGWSRERSLYLRFRDGAIWTTMNGLAEATFKQRETLADFVSKRSGVPVEYPPLGDTSCCSSRSTH